MRILIITANLSGVWGGSEELWAAMARAAIARGHQVCASMTARMARTAQARALAQSGVEIRPRLIYRGIPVRAKEIAYRVTDPYRALARFQPDVICISQGASFEAAQFPDWFALRRLLTSTARPYTAVCHGNFEWEIPSPQHRERIRDFLGNARRVCFVAGRIRDIVERQIVTRLPQAVIVRNPVNLQDRSLVPWPAESPLCLACVARLDNNKGIEMLLEALAAPEWRERPWRLNVVGSGPAEPYFQELTRFFGLDERVHFRGYLKDIRAVWADNHLLILPSRSEGLPMVQIEAMLCGRPTLVTDVGGVRECLVDGETGFLAAGATMFAIRAAIERAWLQRDRWRSMGEQAHALARTVAVPDPGGDLLDIVLGSAPRHAQPQLSE